MFKIIATILLSISFLFHLFLNVRAYRARNREIPDELNDVYDTDTYLKWKKYSAEIIVSKIVFSSISFIITLAILLSNLFAFIVRDINNPYLSSIIVLTIYLFIGSLIGVIESYINDMKIEEKYGFNKTSIKTFIMDNIKGLILSLILTIGLTCLFIVLYQYLNDYILILFTAIMIVFVLFVSFLYPVFSKLFNKFTSLPEGELRTKLTSLLQSHGYTVRDIKVMDASRRTTKSNAYFTGFSKMKTIVLYDNLLKVMEENEIIGIFAHEMGHGLHKDTLKNQILSFINIAIIVTFCWLLAKFPEIYYDFGFSTVNYGFGVILLSEVVLSNFSVLFGLLSSIISRKAEYKADEQAVIEGYSDYLISGLKKLFKENLGDLNPDPLIVILSYSHPTLLQRIMHIKEFKEKK